MFAGLKSKLLGSVSRFSGKTDFLEAVCASAALVASADGEISDDEVKATLKAVTSNSTLTSAFKTPIIEKCIDGMLKKAGSGRTGRLALFKEIGEGNTDLERGETIYLVALDVAEADGNIGDKERTVLNTIAKQLGVNPERLNAV
jgi:tellurite resistance protein TerB